MKWQGRDGSSNVSRGSSGGGPVKIGGVGLLLLVIVYSLFGGNQEILSMNKTEHSKNNKLTILKKLAARKLKKLKRC